MNEFFCLDVFDIDVVLLLVVLLLFYLLCLIEGIEVMFLLGCCFFLRSLVVCVDMLEMMLLWVDELLVEKVWMLVVLNMFGVFLDFIDE